MKIASKELLAQLSAQTRNHISRAEAFRDLPLEKLNWKASDDSWSMLECLEHLNLYGDFYLPEIKRVIEKSSTPSEETFSSGLLGNYFANSMLPKQGMKTMKTFADKNPAGSALDASHLKRFIEQQQAMLQLQASAASVSLRKTKTGISISKWIRLRLGDTFRFVINHNERHLVQAEKIYLNN